MRALFPEWSRFVSRRCTVSVAGRVEGKEGAGGKRGRNIVEKSQTSIENHHHHHRHHLLFKHGKYIRHKKYNKKATSPSERLCIYMDKRI